jgi:hypothetical protein
MKGNASASTGLIHKDYEYFLNRYILPTPHACTRLIRAAASSFMADAMKPKASMTGMEP